MINFCRKLTPINSGYQEFNFGSSLQGHFHDDDLESLHSCICRILKSSLDICTNRFYAQVSHVPVNDMECEAVMGTQGEIRPGGAL